MVPILISIAAKIAEYPVLPILRQFDYLFDFSKNVNNLSDQAEKLRILRRQVNEEVQRATIRGDLIESQVTRWLAGVDEILKQVGKIEEQSKTRKNRLGGFCPNCVYRYRTSRKSTKKVISITQLREQGNFDRVSRQAPLPGIEYLCSKNFIAFDSRKEAADQILEALGNNECNVVVLHGTRGIGKTDLAKEVGKTLKGSLFEEVVMAVFDPNSKTPSLRSIQNQLADMLGLKIQEESDYGRARRLCMRLKNEEKILIILDGVKERLDLEAIGIPSALDHKGCKIMITTEDEKMWKSMGDGVKNVEIKALSEEESWRLFRSVTGEIADTPAFKVVAEDIVGKCMGLPLMIVNIGKRLRPKKIEEWKDASRVLGGPDTKSANLDEFLDGYV